MNVLILGATGMVGQGVMRECLLDGGVARVVTLGRRATGAANCKVRELRRAQPADACLAAPLASRRGDSRAGTRPDPGADSDSHARACTDRADACFSCSDRHACPGAVRPRQGQKGRAHAAGDNSAGRDDACSGFHSRARTGTAGRSARRA